MLSIYWLSNLAREDCKKKELEAFFEILLVKSTFFCKEMKNKI
jgi:hypothetical protein